MLTINDHWENYRKIRGLPTDHESKEAFFSGVYMMFVESLKADGLPRSKREARVTALGDEADKFMRAQNAL